MGGMRRCLLVGTLLWFGLALAAFGSAWAGGGEEEMAGVQELRESPRGSDVGGELVSELSREGLSGAGLAESPKPSLARPVDMKPFCWGAGMGFSDVAWVGGFAVVGRPARQGGWETVYLSVGTVICRPAGKGKGAPLTVSLQLRSSGSWSQEDQKRRPRLPDVGRPYSVSLRVAHPARVVNTLFAPLPLPLRAGVRMLGQHRPPSDRGSPPPQADSGSGHSLRLPRG